MSPLGRLQQTRLAKVRFRPVHSISKRRLLAARQELLSFFLGQLKVVCKLIYDVADPVLLPIARNVQNWQH